MPSPLIRPASADDLEAIDAIYNHYVLHSTATYQTEPETMDDRRAWFARHGDGHPVTVAELDGRVVGWGSLSRFHPRSAYRHTVENSVYVDHNLHRRGIGRALMEDLLVRATRIGHRTVIAGIDAEQTASIGLHRALGFTEVARLRKVGFKFHRWLDVIYMQRMTDRAAVGRAFLPLTPG